MTAGGATLRVAGHDGGDVDWFTADAAAPLPHPDLATRQVVPQRLHYPGAPAPRWWQIEDAAVDIGGFPPDRSHLATALLIELDLRPRERLVHRAGAVAGAAPRRRRLPPSSGVVVTLGAAKVKDSFDDWWTLTIPPGDDDPPAGADEAPGPWSLFRTAGLDRSSLVVWPTATTPLSGPVMDDVILGVDEDANVLWAVELRADGLDLALSADSSAALEETRRTGTREFTWQPSTTLPEHWHPYRIESRSAPARPGFRPGPRRRPEPEPAGHATRPPFRTARRRRAATCWLPRRSRIRACASSDGTCSRGAPTDGRCCGASGDGYRCSRAPSPTCGSTCFANGSRDRRSQVAGSSPASSTPLSK